MHVAQCPAAARAANRAVGDRSWRKEAMNWYQAVPNQGPGEPAR